jgi:hypothetical protein
MPALYSLACTHCDNSKMFGRLEVPYVRMEDGGRKILSHPGEDRAARALTGMNLASLRRAGRMGSVRAHVCERCMKFDHFDLAEVPQQCSQCAGTSILRITPRLREAPSHLKCLKCREGTFVLQEVGWS